MVFEAFFAWQQNFPTISSLFFWNFLSRHALRRAWACVLRYCLFIFIVNFLCRLRDVCCIFLCFRASFYILRTNFCNKGILTAKVSTVPRISKINRWISPQSCVSRCVPCISLNGFLLSGNRVITNNKALLGEMCRQICIFQKTQRVRQVKIPL